MKSSLLVMTVLALGIGAAVLFIRAESPMRMRCGDCNVVIIGVDTLRADHVHSIGYERKTTPTLDTLADRGVLFTNAISPSSWTVPAFMSIFTGVYPSVHGVTNKYSVYNKTEKTISNLKTISPGIQTLAEVMKQAGYATGGFTGDAGVSHAFGYGQGYDVYTDDKTFGGFENSQDHALSWIDSLKGKKFFMFFHGYDLHGQFQTSNVSSSTFTQTKYGGKYTGSPKEEEILREAQLTGPIYLTPADVDFWKSLYDGKIYDADRRLQNFVDELQKRGLLDKTIIVIVSDHGEEYFDHQGFDHGHTLYDELIHVPLIIDIPAGPRKVIVRSQVTTMDIIPTLLDITGVKPDKAFATQIQDRKDLAGYFTEPNTAGYDVFSETDYRDFTHKRSIRTADGWKFILTLESGREELYDLRSDPHEATNMVQKETERAAELRTKLKTHMQKDLHFDFSKQISTGCLPVYKGECEHTPS